MTDFTPARRHGTRILAAAIAVIAVASLTLAPRAIAAPARAAFVAMTDAFIAPLLAWLPYGYAEQVLNTILFVPLGVTLALLLSRRAWPVAIIAGLALSAVVEYAQGSIPGRVPDLDDVLWNTVGAAIGAIVVTAPRLVAAAARRGRQRGSVTRT
ncbi:MAG TPA: VanZ family protein [Microbacterium sp.]|nr:VanZ family protein [Microbacterium sp.]